MRSSARPRAAVLALCAALLAGGCKRGASEPPVAGSAAASAAAMGTWPEWRDLTPLVEAARAHATKPTIAALERARGLLREGKARAADRALAELADSDGRHWIATARADLASLYFTVCLRGIAWRLPETIEAHNRRSVDFDEGVKIEPGDVAIEALLTALDGAVDSQVPALSTQGRIARARTTAYVGRCAPNDDVAQLAQAIFKSDLAQLAAEGHLTPDLAYLWGGVQLGEYSGAAARPFLLQAREAGFDDPAVPYMLAVIALEQRELEQAEKYAKEAITAFTALKDPVQEAQAHFVVGEIARARKDGKAALGGYEAALKRDPEHTAALLGLVRVHLEEDGEIAATRALSARLRGILGEGELGADKAKAAADTLESMVILIAEPPIASACRAALLQDIDGEPDALRRGLRYYFAATLDIRLAEFQSAKGHAVLARDEIAESGAEAPVDVEDLLRNLDGID